MKKLIIIIALFGYTQLISQNTNFAISLNYMIDYDWYKPLQTFPLPTLLYSVNVQSRTPLCFALLIENNYKNISPSIGINFIQRNLVYSQNYTNLTTFSHQTIELPINITKRKNIGAETNLLFNIGGGLSYILTPTKKTQFGLKYYDSLVYEFSIVNPNKINGFINAGIGIENKIGNAGILQIKIQYVYYTTAILRYNLLSNGFIQTTSPFRNNYASIGLTYYPDFKKLFKFQNSRKQE
jgi:hypothetical protein